MNAPSRLAVDLLGRSWRQCVQRLDKRCHGMTDDELLWEPAERCWNLERDEAHPGGWTYPYEFAPPWPPPITTIGWRLVHLVADNLIYVEHAFGPPSRSFPDLPVHGTAAQVLADWRSSTVPMSTWLESATDADLTADSR